MTRTLMPPQPWGVSDAGLADLNTSIGALDTRLIATNTKLDQLHTDNIDPIAEMPPVPLNNTKTRPRATIANGNTASAQVLVAAVGGQTVRMGRTFLSLSAATLFEILNGASSVVPFETFGPFSGLIDITDNEAIIVTTAGNALQVKTTPAVRIYISTEYEQS